MKTIGIIDYRMGNLGSVSSALDRLGIKSTLVQKEREIEACDGLIIPGVGAFGAAMNQLCPLKSAILDFVASEKPILGICLGMQILFEQGTEGGTTQGLGLLEGTVEKMSFAQKLPHIGWNTVRLLQDSRLFNGIKSESWFYFVHSFACKPAKQICTVAVTEYGNPFVSAVERRNIFGVQFHPEKSGKSGEMLLNNFCEVI